MSPETKCIGSVWTGWHHVKCSRKASIDKYCGIHHPDKVKARKKKQEAKWEQASAVRNKRLDEQAKRESYRDFCEKNFDALVAALELIKGHKGKTLLGDGRYDEGVNQGFETLAAIAENALAAISKERNQ